ncbi:MAG: hypothetical protein ACRDJ4_00285 [Actinomycetota bacterium]
MTTHEHPSPPVSNGKPKETVELRRRGTAWGWVYRRGGAMELVSSNTYDSPEAAMQAAGKAYPSIPPQAPPSSAGGRVDRRLGRLALLGLLVLVWLVGRRRGSGSREIRALRG